MSGSQKMEPMAAIWCSSNNRAILDSVKNTSVHFTSIYGKPKNNDKKSQLKNGNNGCYTISQ